MLQLLEDKAFNRVTVRDIAARAGIGYATFFRHYAAKEELLHDVVADEIAALLAIALPTFQATRTRESALALCTYVHERRVLWTTLLTGGAAGVVRDEFIRQARKIRVGRGQTPDWLPAELGVVHGVAATLEILTWWLRRERRLPVTRIADILHRLVLSPIMRPR